MIKIIYKADNFNTYLYYLVNFAFNNVCYKCEHLINSIGIAELGEKWYKKCKTRSIKWSN